LILKTKLPQRYIIAVITTAPTRFRNSPVLAICPTLIREVPNIMAFGGVATGSIKAIEADIVAGIISSSGLIFVVMAIPASIGRTISVVAVLDVSSVRNVIIRDMTSIITIGWSEATPASWLPNQSDNPDSLNPVARANPPPNSSNICQGSFDAVAQSNSLAPFSLRDGTRKSINAINIATVPSFINEAVGKIPPHPGITNLPKLRSARKIQRAASRVNITKTNFSSKLVLPIPFSKL